MGKFSLHLVLMTQWRGRELCGHYSSLSLSRKLQSSLAFKGNYSDEPVICSGVGITQSSPESSCMKRLEDPSEKKHWEKRGDGAEDKNGPSLTSQDTGVGAQHQLWPCGFDHFYGHLDQGQEHTHPLFLQSWRGKGTPHLSGATEESSQQQGKF